MSVIFASLRAIDLCRSKLRQRGTFAFQPFATITSPCLVLRHIKPSLFIVGLVFFKFLQNLHILYGFWDAVCVHFQFSLLVFFYRFPKYLFLRASLRYKSMVFPLFCLSQSLKFPLIQSLSSPSITLNLYSCSYSCS